MWNTITAPATHPGSGSIIPVHFSDYFPSENANMDFSTGMNSFVNKRTVNNDWTDQTKTPASQASNWLENMSDDTGIFNELQKSDLDFADITSTIKVDESDFMHYDIEDIKLEWPTELKPPQQGSSRVSPEPEILSRADSPLPVLSTFAVNGILGNLPPVSPPLVSQPSFLPKKETLNFFPSQSAVENLSPVYINYRPPVQNSLYHWPLTVINSPKTSNDVSVDQAKALLRSEVSPIRNDVQIPSRQRSGDVAGTDAASDTSWQDSSDEEYDRKFEHEHQIEEILRCYQKGGINADEHCVYCELCNRRWRRSCPHHGKLKHVRDKRVPMGTEGRAKKTAPRFLSILPSKIQGATEGVWTKKPILERTYFGPYEGCEVPLDHQNGEYCWKVMKDGKPEFLVDGSEPSRSNWMRYVNCARTAEEQNLEAFQFGGAIFYRTTQLIEPNQELLVWYGYKCARKLGIKWKDFVESTPPNKKVTAFSCGSCFHAYANPILLEQHKRRSRCKRSLPPLKDFPECTEERETKPLVSIPDSSVCMEVTTGDMPITCGVCGARFHRRGKPLQNHVKSHDRKHNCCLKCGQWFPNMFALTEHTVAVSRHSRELSNHARVVCYTKSRRMRFKSVRKVLEIPECTIERRKINRETVNKMNEGRPTYHDGGKIDRPISHTEVEVERLVPNTGINEDRPISHTGGIIEDRPILPTEADVKPPISLTRTNEDRPISQTEADEKPRFSHTGTREDRLISPTGRNIGDRPISHTEPDRNPSISHTETREDRPISLPRMNENRLSSNTVINQSDDRSGDGDYRLGDHGKGKTSQVRRNYKYEWSLCDRCGFMFQRICLLNRHLQHHHGVQSKEQELFARTCRPKRFKCKECGILYRKKATLEQHLKLHEETSGHEESEVPEDERKFSCSKCDMKFRARATLQYHMGVHQEKPKTVAELFNPNSTKKFKCKKCHVRFRARSTLKLHCKTHGEETSPSVKLIPSLRPRSKLAFFSGDIFKKTPRTDLRGLAMDKTVGVKCEVGIQERYRSPPREQQTESSKRKDNDPDELTSKRPRIVECLECLACGFIFRDRASLDAHVRKHVEEKKLVCDLSSVRVSS